MLYTTNIINREQNDIDNIAEIIKKSIYSEIKQNNYNYIAKNILDYLGKKREHEHTIPKIGEYWRHPGSPSNVYKRIPDEVGINYYKGRSESFYNLINSLFSIKVGEDFSIIYRTRKENSSFGFEILKPVGFEDDTLLFEVIE